MKLMYSIIIVVAAALLIFLALRSSAKKPETRADKTTSSTQQTMQTGNNQAAPGAGTESASELLMTVTKEGTGPAAKDGDVLVVNYTGYLSDGTKFDSSLDRGTPFEFTLGSGMVISGWDIGLRGMKQGEIRKLVIPAKYAYGEKGFPGVIPPNATLAFEVELMEIKPAN